METTYRLNEDIHTDIPEEKLYTYIIIRDDLEMTPGKMASQVSHARSIALLKYIQANPHRLSEFIDANVAGSAIVLRAKNLHALETLHAQADNEGFITALFSDSGHIMPPHFDGSPTITALAIGPSTKDSMRHLTKKFRLLG